MSQINTTNYGQYTTSAAYQTTQAKKTQTNKEDKAKDTNATIGSNKAEAKKEVKGTGTYGNPMLSEKALKYYNNLTKRFGNLNFVLVAADKKDEAQAKQASFANASKLTVLIDTDKIEKMATDEAYREKYEGIIRGATTQVAQLASKLGDNAKNVKGYGMSIDKTGNASFFAVLEVTTQKQKERIEAKTQAKKEAKKAEEKKAEKEEKEEKLEEKIQENYDSDEITDTEIITVTANSIEELMKKINDTYMGIRSEGVMTAQEIQVGQSFDITI